MSIAVKNISKRFGDFVALDDVSLNVPHGELLALLGPSGSGKTTLLRIIAGLESADQGSVHYADEDVTESSARERAVGFVFQHYALFRHMNVFENVAFGLRVRKEKKNNVERRVRELLHLVRLDGLERRFPSQLSGGPATAGGAGPGAGHSAEGAAAGRAVRRAGRQGATGTAGLAAGPAR